MRAAGRRRSFTEQFHPRCRTTTGSMSRLAAGEMLRNVRASNASAT